MQFSSNLLFRALQASLLFLFASFHGVAQAPSFAWAQPAGGISGDAGSGIAVDGSGNSYVTGSFQGTATFGSSTLTASSIGNNDLFIAKYDASGNVLWAQKAGGNSIDNGFGIVVDGSGNSYITGSFQGTASFGSITISSSGAEDVFIAKYDATGNVIWAQKAGGPISDVGYGIAVDSSGNSYITGFFEGSATFGSITLTSSNSGNHNIFIAKYDASGIVLWAQQSGATVNSIVGNGITADDSGNSYVTGYFQGSATLGGTTLTSNGDLDVFIAKYDATGNALWAQQAGANGLDYGADIAIDGSGNSYITGNFEGSTTFGSITLTTISSDMFIAKYDATGNVIWAQKAGGTNGDPSSGNGIAVDPNGNSYVTGNFQGSATFGTTTLTKNGIADVFIAKYDATGNVIWAQQAGQTIYDIISNGIAADGSGNSYVTGYFQGSATFGSSTLTSNGTYDVFLCKLGSTVTGLPSEISAALPSFPNPISTSFQLSLPGTGPATVVLTDVLGREVHRQAVLPPAAESTVLISPAAHLPSGVYGLQIWQDGSVKQGKVLKQ